jgi:hypothetical protein
MYFSVFTSKHWLPALDPAHNPHVLNYLGVTPLESYIYPIHPSRNRLKPKDFPQITSCGGTPPPTKSPSPDALVSQPTANNQQPATGNRQPAPNNATLTASQAPDTLFKFGDAAIFLAARPADLRRFRTPDAVKPAGPMQFFCMRPGNTIQAGTRDTVFPSAF